MLRCELEYFLGAIRFFTRLPVPAWVGHSAEKLDASTRYFPAVGLIVGAIGALVYLAALQLWPQPVAVLLAMAATLYATGAFHEDGLSDAVDGLGGGWDKQRILEIMKDSRVGNYGVIVLWLGLTGKFVVLAALDPAAVPWALVAGHAVSRYVAIWLMVGMSYVREDLQAKAKPLATRLSAGSLVVATGFAALGLLPLAWPQALAGCLLAALVTGWLAAKFRRWLGGYTGDCLGAAQQVAEIAFYLGLLVQWPQ
ncbi:MAG: adenosylcobinamide-GDP ribazoletransferase [Azonexus sp.]|jgi:adenosylcobinamide-GDP ribazoletransferase|uniref:adenosylcobinamide-GDP ribazoletransferase n=1 Tax=Azonexus sp. TaxID=1872668 RepID=UPI00281DB3ED|nr:adenosylcobinamide-GDP ribazoletransferase [Azonexus sp.]MDR0777465.1 adenosylcobinamide-GDP ribazoletransferase [Azonexus sp.]